jgi:hypothetical protein
MAPRRRASVKEDGRKSRGELLSDEQVSRLVDDICETVQRTLSLSSSPGGSADANANTRPPAERMASDDSSAPSVTSSAPRTPSPAAAGLVSKGQDGSGSGSSGSQGPVPRSGSSIPTPIKRAIQARRQSYANASDPVRALPLERQAQPQQKQQPPTGAQDPIPAPSSSSSAGRGLPTPMRRAIHSRRQSTSQPYHQRQPQAIATEDDSQDQAPAPVAKALPTPVRRAIQSRRGQDDADADPAAYGATSTEEAPQAQAARARAMPTPVRRAIQERRRVSVAEGRGPVEQLPGDAPPSAKPLPTPIKRAIQERRQSYASTRGDVLASSGPEAVGPEDNTGVVEEQQAMQVTPAFRRTGAAAVAARPLPTPIRQAIQSRRQSCTGVQPVQAAAAYADDYAEEGVSAFEEHRAMEVTPAPRRTRAPVAKPLPTPVRRAIQSRRQSYAETAAEPVEEEEEQAAYAYEYAEDEGDAFEELRTMEVTPAPRRTRAPARKPLPTPVRQAIQSRRQSYAATPAEQAEEAAAYAYEYAEDEGDAFEDQRAMEVTPAPRRSRRITKPAPLPTPLRRDIQARRTSYGPTAGEEGEEATYEYEYAEDDGDAFEEQRAMAVTPAVRRSARANPRDMRPLPTPVRTAIQARRTTPGPVRGVCVMGMNRKSSTNDGAIL